MEAACIFILLDFLMQQHLTIYFQNAICLPIFWISTIERFVGSVIILLGSFKIHQALLLDKTVYFSGFNFGAVFDIETTSFGPQIFASKLFG